MSEYYRENFERYNHIFNETRKAFSENSPFPLTDFLRLNISAMMHATNRAQDKLNESLAGRLFDAHLHCLFSEGQLNLRQHVIVTQLKLSSEPLTSEMIFSEPWSKALYEGLSDRTKKRDIKGLIELGLVFLDDEENLLLTSTRPSFALRDDPFCSF